ncbi:hypothetical protein AUK40_02425 [Candidatus Wirthbacteria bacterium CG2_30_54_11]|uniref:DUF559 domain-containing protein n=1 Tax=Candidatus Wirthbacteria bacterium CG2_30_54_11 TaxID=1817892 RepID=A0A1J5IXE6_9BACT|nr:MAG: hypothetical protein AUK40_02425 [Candidatus Wirthbacteria bacterium CG2_30_54_11]
MRLFNKAVTKEHRIQLRQRSTEAEIMLWKYLRNKRTGNKFFRQYGIGPYIADFYCPELKLVIEVDGGQHYTEQGAAYDAVRAEYMRSVGIETIRFTNAEVLQRIDSVIAVIVEAAKLTPPNPLFQKVGG